jgi:hypothetical protein
MRKLFLAIIGITMLFASCESDNLILQTTTSNVVGVYQFEKTSIYPTVGKDFVMKNNVELTFLQDLKNPNQVFVEELGIYAKINGNQVDIPFQTDAAAQFSYTGYGEINGENLQLFLNIKNHTSNTIQTSEMHGQRLEFLD